MAQVPYTGVPSVAPQGPNPNLRESIPSSSADFGGMSAAATGALGKGAQDAGAGFMSAAIKQQEVYNQVAVQEARNQQEEIYHNIAFGDSKVPGDVGIFGLYGRAAMDARPAAMAKLEEARENIRGKLLNDAQRNEFDKESHRYKTIIADSIGRHVDSQSHAWAMTVNKANLQNATQIAGSLFNDDSAFAHAFNIGMGGAVRGVQATGNGNDKTIMAAAMNDVRSHLVVSRLEEWSSRGNPIEALNWLKNGVLPDGTKAQEAVLPHVVGGLQHTLQERVDQFRVRGFADTFIPSAVGAGTAAPSITPITSARAQAVYEGLVKRGMDADTAWGFAANAVGESGAIPGRMEDNGGPGRGLFQWTSKDRVASFAKNNGGLSPEQGTLDQQLDHVMYELGGPESSAWQAIQNTPGGPAEKAAAISKFYERPRDEAGAMRTRASIAAQLAKSPALTTRNPDVFAAEESLVEDARKKAAEQFPDRPDLQAAAVHGVEQRIERTNIRQRQYDAAVDKQRKEASAAAMDEYTPKIIMNPGDVSIDKIASDQRLTAADKWHLNGMIKAQLAGQTEKISAVSHQMASNLLSSMRRPEGDPARISDLAPVYKAYTDGYLTNADFTFVQNQFKAMQTDDGQSLTQVEQRFFQAAKPSIEKSNALQGTLDKEGGILFYSLQQEVAKKVAEYRKEGKNPYDLFDPSKPDFVGKPEALAPYQRSVPESMTAYMEKMAAEKKKTDAKAGAAKPEGPGFFGRLFGTNPGPAGIPKAPSVGRVPLNDIFGPAVVPETPKFKE